MCEDPSVPPTEEHVYLRTCGTTAMCRSLQCFNISATCFVVLGSNTAGHSRLPHFLVQSCEYGRTAAASSVAVMILPSSLHNQYTFQPQQKLKKASRAGIIIIRYSCKNSLPEDAPESLDILVANWVKSLSLGTCTGMTGLSAAPTRYRDFYIRIE